MSAAARPRGCATFLSSAIVKRRFYAPARVRARVITFVLGECELELVPRELLGAPSVKRRARERRRPPEHLLLDQARDHEALAALPDGDRRGRPDIVHLVTLLVQDSPLAAAGQTRLLWHTRNGELVHVRRDLRPPRAQSKFYQLCEDLLRQGEVPMGKPLLRMERGVSLSEALAREGKGPIVLLAEEGAPARTPTFTALAREHADLTLLVGGFPRGTWREEPPRQAAYRVHHAPLTAASALVPVLAGFEDALLA